MTTLRNHWPVARKSHTCGVCGQRIHPAEKYRRTVWVEPGFKGIAQLVCCEPCDSLACDLFRDGVYGEDHCGAECYPWLPDLSPGDVPDFLRQRLADWRVRYKTRVPA